MDRDQPRRGNELSGIIRDIFGERLAGMRKSASPRISQGALAAELGVTRASVSNIEHGRHRVFLDQVYICARVLRRPVTDLLPTMEELEIAGRIHLPDNSGLEALTSELSEKVQEVIASVESPGSQNTDVFEEEL